jgi:hypothetical protein
MRFSCQLIDVLLACFLLSHTDPDMLEVGNGGMAYDEYVVHFSLWAIAKVRESFFFQARNYRLSLVCSHLPVEFLASPIFVRLPW